MSYLSKQTLVPWKGLQAQLGADYARPRDYRRTAFARLEDVVGAYPEVRIRRENDGLRLYPSPPHVESHASKRVVSRSGNLRAVPRQIPAEYPAESAAYYETG